jgi:20S proteasome alpha/beta subunit
MTLCIAARATVPSPLTPCIVLCFDYLAANDWWGSEGEYKFYVLSEQLVAMVAGAVAQTKELAHIYQAYLRTNKLSADDAEATKQLRIPLGELKSRTAESYVQRRLAVSYREFRKNGKKDFGPEVYYRYLAAIEKHQPNVEMIIAGFEGGTPRLYHIRRDDGNKPVELEDATNFCLIGSGSIAAEPTLHARKQTSNTPLSQALYNIYEAKKLGEASPWVGEKTRMFVLKPPDNGSALRAQVVTDAGEKWLKQLYRRYGPKPMKTWPDLPVGVFQTAHLSGLP